MLSLAKAQEATPTSILSLKSGSTLLVRSDDTFGQAELWLINPFNDQEELFINLRQPSYRIYAIQLTGNQSLFTLEVEGTWDTGFFHLGPSRIVKIDIRTHERTIVYSDTNLVDLMVSPDASHMLIRSYPEDFTTVDRSNISQAQWCLLAIGDLDAACQMIDQVGNNLSYPTWVNSRIIAYTSDSGRLINLVSIDTLELMPIEMPQGFDADIIAPMPVSGNLIILDAPFLQDESLHVFKLDTNSLTITSIGKVEDLQGAYSIVISPNEDSGVIVGTRDAYLISLEDAHVFQSYPTFYDMVWSNIQWLPTEHTHFLIGQMRFRSHGGLTVVFEPNSNVAANILPVLDGELIVVK
jgi:hypothetical protein